MFKQTNNIYDVDIQVLWVKHVDIKSDQ